MADLWDKFSDGLRQKGTTAESLLRATEAELEEIFTELGYRALERAALRTEWYEKRGKLSPTGGLEYTTTTEVVPKGGREYNDVDVLLKHYVCPEAGMTISIVELERISSPVLQKRYERRKAELTDGGVVRRFHSPVSSNNTKIQDTGFTLPATGAQMSLRFLTKAPAAHPTGAYKLLLCEVAVGKYKACSGNGDSITPEQLVSEGFDSAYLFYTGVGGGTAHQDTPDEFLLFHPDQALARHVVTFIVHQTPAAPPSPSHSPPQDVSQLALANVPISATPRSGAVGGSTLKYWIQAENQLVSGDSLLVGENKGKTFVPVAEGSSQQLSEILSRGQSLNKSVQHLRGQLQELSATKIAHEECEAGIIQYIKDQTLRIHEMIEQRREEATQAVEEATSLAVSAITDDYTTISNVLEALESYDAKITNMVQLSRSHPEEFLLSSSEFLESMDSWSPSYIVNSTLTVPEPLNLVFDTEGVQNAISALSISEAPSDMQPAQVKRIAQPDRRDSNQQSWMHRERKSTLVIEEVKGGHQSAHPPTQQHAHSQKQQQQQQQQHQHDILSLDHHVSERTDSVRRSHHGGPSSARRSRKPQQAGSRSSTPSGQLKRRTPSARSPNTKPGNKIPSYNVCLVGDAGVGKTRLMEAWLGEDPPLPHELEIYHPSREPETYTFKVLTSKGKLLISITDCPGSRLFPDALGSADAAVVVFDCTSHSSYGNISTWYSYLPYHIPVALCGNKSNESNRVVRSKEITFHTEVNAAIKETAVSYHDISVSTRYNVDKPWTWICRKLQKDPHLIVKEIIATRVR
eukprot:TRINITY_DN4121_c0_g1_i1.p1 TRINITY_DN4121_c0_g1~~TRINITY_DN4121_c0_g1_i1.p1  ORF type:complete len:804 (+),score=127.48 TRINITY_DN4121_c0_g1_i1:57-2468(+)